MGVKKLTELGGEIRKGSRLLFSCPVCSSGHTIMISWIAPSVVKDGSIWKKINGSNINDITIRPSVNCDIKGSDCKFHGHITNGIASW